MSVGRSPATRTLKKGDIAHDAGSDAERVPGLRGPMLPQQFAGGGGKAWGLSAADSAWLPAKRLANRMRGGFLCVLLELDFSVDGCD
jgi:hypothetical protein